MNNNENIVLVGFMGCGKSSIGRRIGYKIDRTFIDTDYKIQNETDMSINEIFEKFGEEYFRKLETDLCREFSVKGENVIATGGGIIKNDENVKLLKKKGKIIYLKAEPETIYANIRYDETRPLLKGGNKLEKIKKLLAERISLYEKYADITYTVDRRGIDESAEDIIKLMGLESKNEKD